MFLAVTVNKITIDFKRTPLTQDYFVVVPTVSTRLLAELAIYKSDRSQVGLN